MNQAVFFRNASYSWGRRPFLHFFRLTGQERRPLRRGFAALLVVLSLLSLTQCRQEQGTSSSFARQETLYIGGPQWGEPSSFNPLAGSPDWPVKNYFQLMYETLFAYHSLKGELHPILAESYSQSREHIDVYLRAEPRWSDGRALTAHDVKFSVDVGIKHKGAPVAQVWPFLEEVLILDEAEQHPRKLRFVLNKKRLNPLAVLDTLQQLRIVPKHIIEPLLGKANDDLNEFLKLKFDKDPVISGPFQLHSYNGEKIVTVRRDDYWGNGPLYAGKRAIPKYIIHPIYKANDHYSVALQQGRLDAASSFIPRIWLKKRKGVHAWYDEAPYFVPTAIPMLLINHTKKKLQDPALRRAMAFAINYKDIRELAVSGYSQPIESGLILPFGPESAYFSKADADKFGASRFDPEQSRKTLKEAGYTSLFNEDGDLLEMRNGSGKRVPTIFIKSAAGWTDWEAIVRIAVKGMRSAGIDVRERFVDGGMFWNATVTGDFDLIMNTPVPPPAPSKPWSRLDSVLTSNDWAPLGEKMYKNQGRFNQPGTALYEPRINELLELIPTLDNEERKKQSYRELNRLFMRLQPSIPVVYRPHEFYQFSEKHWKGFATADNPYLPPSIPSQDLGTQMLWHLQPVESH